MLFLKIENKKLLLISLAVLIGIAVFGLAGVVQAADITTEADLRTKAGQAGTWTIEANKTYTLTANLLFNANVTITVDETGGAGDVIIDGADTYTISLATATNGVSVTVTLTGTATSPIIFQQGATASFNVNNAKTNAPVILTMNYCYFTDSKSPYDGLTLAAGPSSAVTVTCNYCKSYLNAADGFSIAYTTGTQTNESKLYLNNCESYQNGANGLGNGDGVTAHAGNQFVYIVGGKMYQNRQGGINIIGGSYCSANGTEIYGNDAYNEWGTGIDGGWDAGASGGAATLELDNCIFHSQRCAAAAIGSWRISTSADTLNSPYRAFTNGTAVWLRTSDTLPSPLITQHTYYIVNSSGNTFQLSETLGGSAIDITTTGGGYTYVDNAQTSYIAASVYFGGAYGYARNCIFRDASTDTVDVNANQSSLYAGAGVNTITNNIFDNIMGSSGSQGFMYAIRTSTTGTYTIANNTVYQSQGVVLQSSNHSVNNNIFYTSTTSQTCINGGSSLYYSNNAVNGYNIVYGYTTDVSNSGTLKSTDLDADPKFIDAPNNNFGLLLTSPFIDAGVDVNVNTDYAGKQRYDHPNITNTGSAGSYTKAYVDMGAYEYVTPPDPTLTSTSHPSESTWYNDATPDMSLSSNTSSTTHYHYLVNQTASPTKAQVEAGTEDSDGTFTVPAGTISSDGTWYVHIVAQNLDNDSSTNFDTYTIKYDATVPSSVGTPSFGTIATDSIIINKPTTVTEESSGLYQWQVRRGGTTELGWNATSTTSDTDSSLSANTQYAYDVQFKDNASNNSNYGTSASKYTLALTPTNLTAILDSKKVTLTVDSFTNDTSDSSGYYFYRSDNTNSGWIQTNTWQDTTFGCNASYNWHVKYRNGDGTETDAVVSSSIEPNPCGGGGGYFQLPSSPPIPSTPPTSSETATPTTKPITEMTVVELQSEINRITSLIIQLQSQISQLQTTTNEIPSGYQFTKTLKYGQNSDEVRYLQIFLKSQGTEIYPEGLITGYFGLLTKSAVIRFQEKYAQDILTPLGLTKGTGFVGEYTRIKLNKLL